MKDTPAAVEVVVPGSALDQDAEFGAPLGICYACIHYHHDFTCDAFPDGVPIEVLSGRFDHSEGSFPGDHGITFELDPNAEFFD